MKPDRAKSSLLLQMIFVVALLVNLAFWFHSRNVLPEWNNVPPAPKATSARMISLGDPEIAYRLFGYFLQNAGNTGGRYESLKKYDYAVLEQWFLLTLNLNPRSDLVPVLAAYYFGTLDDEPAKMSHVSDYLAVVGKEPYPEKWRWLAHAVFMARHKENNLPKALELANTLAGLKGDVAPWGRQMPAFVNVGMGNKEAAYEIMVRILATESEKLHPNEVNFMVDFICKRTLSMEQANQDPLCRDNK